MTNLIKLNFEDYQHLINEYNKLTDYVYININKNSDLYEHIQNNHLGILNKNKCENEHCDEHKYLNSKLCNNCSKCICVIGYNLYNIRCSDCEHIRIQNNMTCQSNFCNKQCTTGELKCDECKLCSRCFPESNKENNNLCVNCDDDFSRVDDRAKNEIKSVENICTTKNCNNEKLVNKSFCKSCIYKMNC